METPEQPTEAPLSAETEARQDRRKTRRLIGVVGFLMLLAAVALWAFLKPGWRPVIINIHAPPTLVVDATERDLGTVKMDDEVHTRFYLTNTGGRELRIYGVEASCGCTVATPKQDVLQPGDSTPLDVTLDTSAKLGSIVKTIDITTNDPAHPVTTLTLRGEAEFRMKGHKPIPVRDPLVVFKGKCATCHALKGEGKSGEALWLADCAMCHGPKAAGGVAGSLANKQWQDEAERARLRAVIANGAKNNPTMPPYAKANGGPLTESQIDSLVVYLSAISQSEQK